VRILHIVFDNTRNNVPFLSVYILTVFHAYEKVSNPWCNVVVGPLLSCEFQFWKMTGGTVLLSAIREQEWLQWQVAAVWTPSGTVWRQNVAIRMCRDMWTKEYFGWWPMREATTLHGRGGGRRIYDRRLWPSAARRRRSGMAFRWLYSQGAQSERFVSDGSSCQVSVWRSHRAASFICVSSVLVRDFKCTVQFYFRHHPSSWYSACTLV
jgi:hypothetical protein